MSLTLMRILRPYMAPAGDDGPDTGGTATLDRGDDFEPDGEEADDAGEKKPETKAEEKADEKDEEEHADDKDKPRKDSRIPLARHKEVLEKERAKRADLEKEVENLRRGQVVAATNEDITKKEDSILGLEKEYNKALADGELDKASTIMRNIRAAERQIADAKVAMSMQAAEARAYERVRYDAVLDRLEEAYPVLSEGSDEYDEGIVAEMVELKGAYQLKGYSPAEALQKAAKVLLGASTTRQKHATTADVRVDKDDLAKATAEERKKAAVARNVDVAKKTPANAAHVGLDSDKAGGAITAKDVIRMPHDEFVKLDERQLAKMRGDEI